jgi:hypothetical protein
MTTKDAEVFVRAGALLLIGAVLWILVYTTFSSNAPAK